MSTVAGGGTQDWTLAPAIPAGESLELSAGTITASLIVDSANQQVTVTARLFDGATQVGTTASQTFTANGPVARSFAIPLAAPHTVPAGGQLVLRVASTGAATTVYQYRGSPSTLSFATTTVVNVDSVVVHSEAYPAATTAPFLVHGATAYIRAVVSDPFGSADVGGANITLTWQGGGSLEASPVVGRLHVVGDRFFGTPFPAERGAHTLGHLVLDGARRGHDGGRRGEVGLGLAPVAHGERDT